MSINTHEDTSYKYRWNQKELLGKILSGTLDEDLYMSDLRIEASPPNGWKYNPIFTGYCFAGAHKLRINVDLGDWNMQGDLLSGLFQSSVNISELVLAVKYSGQLSYISQQLTALCRYAVDMERAEVILADNVRLSSSGSAFYSCPALKTVVLRSNNVMVIGATNAQAITGNVDTIVLDSPVVATLIAANTIASAAFTQGGTGGTIYIPKALYDHLGDGTEYDYKVATNWSVLDSYGTVAWAQIEGSEYEL